jgi:hypothetical protein
VPRIDIIDGIRIVMYWDDHDPPHFHAWKGDTDAMFEIATGRLMQGRLDRRTVRKVQQWTELNQDILIQAWNNCHTIGKKGTTK